MVLHFHLSDTGLRQHGGRALVRCNDTDPATLAELTDWLAGTGCKIVIRPVIDPANTAPADAYEIPDRIRSAVRYREIADASPWGTSTSPNLDLDHTRAFQSGGPPGQTSSGNLAPFVRPVHRVKTVGAKQIRQPAPGIYLSRTRQGHLTVTTNRGSINLGRNPFTVAIWHAAAEQPSRVEKALVDVSFSRMLVAV